MWATTSGQVMLKRPHCGVLGNESPGALNEEAYDPGVAAQCGHTVSLATRRLLRLLSCGIWRFVLSIHYWRLLLFPVHASATSWSRRWHDDASQQRVLSSTIRPARRPQKFHTACTTAESYDLRPTYSSSSRSSGLLALEGQYGPNMSTASSRQGAGRSSQGTESLASSLLSATPEGQQRLLLLAALIGLYATILRV